MNKFIIISSIIALSAASNANARRFLEAGWDFSQYSISGFSTLNGGATFVNTLSANYSDYATATFGAGPSAASFGTLYYDGSFGSSSSPVPFDGPVAPIAINLASNTNIERANDSFVPFNSLATLIDEGQPDANPFGLGISAYSQVVSLVFAAETLLVPLGGSLEFSFAGQSVGEGISVSLEASADGFSYSPVDNFTLTSSEQTFSTDLTNTYYEIFEPFYEPFYLRLNFNPNTTVAIDNVAIHTTVPEPQTYAALLGLSMLVATAVMRKKLW